MAININRLIPLVLRKKIRSFIYTRIKSERAAILKGIPKYDLQSKHIQNLHILIDRIALLENMPKHGTVAELGVNKGEFSEKIIRITSPDKLHLIDAWNTQRYHNGLHNLVTEKFAKEILEGRVEINNGFSTEVGKQFSDGYFDWIYIDTSHSYGVTRSELELFESKMKSSGIITGHDFSMGNWKGGIKYGVIEAVYEFCVKRNWELIYLTMENSTSPSFAIKKIEGVS